MRKIPSLFVRDRGKATQTFVRDEVTPGCEWALTEGVATVKWDGTAVLVKDGVLYARYDAKHGKPAPVGGIACQEPDPETGHWPHWVPATGPESRWIREAFENSEASLKTARDHGNALATPLADGTYEAIGPKINSNRHGSMSHFLMRHDAGVLLSVTDRSFAGLRAYLARANETRYFEGVVFHHSDGRMCKVKTKDFAPT